jgi:hypothetical protein
MFSGWIDESACSSGRYANAAVVGVQQTGLTMAEPAGARPAQAGFAARRAPAPTIRVAHLAIFRRLQHHRPIWDSFSTRVRLRASSDI